MLINNTPSLYNGGLYQPFPYLFTTLFLTCFSVFLVSHYHVSNSYATYVMCHTCVNNVAFCQFKLLFYVFRKGFPRTYLSQFWKGLIVQGMRRVHSGFQRLENAHTNWVFYCQRLLVNWRRGVLWKVFLNI